MLNLGNSIVSTVFSNLRTEHNTVLNSVLPRTHPDQREQQSTNREMKKEMVAGWEEACVDYNGLKRMLEEIRRSKSVEFRDGDIELQQICGGDGIEDKEKIKAEFCLGEETEDSEIMFFKKVDDEAKKVGAFYEEKVREVKEEGDALLKQMDALVALRSKVKEPADTTSAVEEGKKAMSIPVSASSSSNGLTTESITSDEQKPDSSELTHQLDQKSNVNGILEEFEAKSSSSFTKEDLKKVEESLKLAFYDFSREVHRLKQYRLPPVTALTRRLLQNWRRWTADGGDQEVTCNTSFMNLSAFSKILKKYDQIASTSTIQPFMGKVESSYLGNSDEITDLLNKVEHILAKQFSYSKSKEGKRLMRPKKKRDKHSITFILGVLVGCSIALFVAVVLLVQTRKLIDKENAKVYMDNIFPLYSLYAFIILHMLVHAADIYFWRRYRINYPFLFGFKEGTELSYREIFVMSSTLAVLVLSTFLVQLHIRMDTKIQENESQVELVPLGLLIVVFLIVFCPFNTFYRSTRFFLIGCLFRSICAPFFKVTLPDSFLADQLTSQVQAIRNLQHYVCFYGWRSATQKQIKCQSIKGYLAFYYILSIVPYWFRFLQSIRRMIEQKNLMHGYTAMRFIITVMAVVFQTVCRLRNGNIWKVLGLVATIVAITVNTFSDIVLDWGLLRWKSKNKLLRDKLLVPHKSAYFIAIVLNVILRLAWLQLVFDFDMRPMRRQITPFMITVVEIVRRGIWNFFWLENEQLNNIGKFRAFKSVPPLPYECSNKDATKDVVDDKDVQKGD